MKLNPMSEPPSDDRTVLIVVAGKKGKTLFSPGYFDVCWWAVRFNWGDEDAWPIEDHLPKALGWIEAPTVEHTNEQ